MRWCPRIRLSPSLLLTISLLSSVVLAHTTSVRRQNTGYDTDVVWIDPEAWDHEFNFQRFVTRPDIQAPRWDFTVYDEDAVAPGYWFAAPYTEVIQTRRGGEWIGPQIFDHNGELVWSGVPLFTGFGVFDFRVQQYMGEDVLTLVYRHENATILNNRYEIIKKLYVNETGYEMNMHDFNIIENGTSVLLLKTISKKYDTNKTLEMMQDTGLEGFEELEQCVIRHYGFEQLSLDTMEPVFSWMSEGLVWLNESRYNHLEPGPLCNNWDYIHLNSVDKFPNGDYLISARHTDTLYRISGKDGSIVWRFGGKFTDFYWRGRFTGQHDSRIRFANKTHTIISFLDNANRPNANDMTVTNDRSRGMLVMLETINMTASTLERYDQPHALLADGRGSYQVLPNENTLIGWTKQAAFSEFQPPKDGEREGRIVLDATLRPDLKSYRNYKFDWVGHPSEPPVVRSIVFAKDMENTYRTNIYVSWNGATEVKTWRFYSVDDRQRRKLIVSTPRKGFETVYEYDGLVACVVAEAVDRRGHVLGESDAFQSIAPPSVTEHTSPDQVEWIEKHLAIAPPEEEPPEEQPIEEDRPLENQPLGDQPFGDRPFGDRPFGDQPFGHQPFGDQPLEDQPLEDQPLEDDQPLEEDHALEEDQPLEEDQSPTGHHLYTGITSKPLLTFLAGLVCTPAAFLLAFGFWIGFCKCAPWRSKSRAWWKQKSPLYAQLLGGRGSRSEELDAFELEDDEGGLSEDDDGDGKEGSKSSGGTG